MPLRAMKRGDRMYQANTWRERISLFFMILWPILVTQFCLKVMDVVDTIMSGHAGTEDLAGVAIGAGLWLPILTGFNGILLAVTPIVAQLLGGGERKKIAEAVTQAVYLSIILSLGVIIIGAFLVDPILSRMQLEAAVHHIAKYYLVGLSIGIPALFVSSVLRYFFDAQGFTRISMFIMLAAIPVNVFLNYLLIFGKFGFPRLGGIGAGVATGLTFWLVLFLSVLVTCRVAVMREFQLFVKWFRPSWTAWKEQLAIGLPMGFSVFVEASIFAGVTLMIGVMFDTVTIAAHQAATSFTSLLFMLPLAMSMALTILVAYEVGGKRLEVAKEYSLYGVSGAMLIMGLISIFLYLFREQIGYMYTSNLEVITLIKQFFLFAILYQLSDAAQAALQGVLRGYKDVTIPFIIALVSYWVIGFPVGYLLAAYTDLAPFGFWVGITIGLTSAALGFFFRLRLVQKKAMGLMSK